jgi:hypothetical protein
MINDHYVSADHIDTHALMWAEYKASKTCFVHHIVWLMPQSIVSPFATDDKHGHKIPSLAAICVVEPYITDPRLNPRCRGGKKPALTSLSLVCALAERSRHAVVDQQLQPPDDKFSFTTTITAPHPALLGYTYPTTGE